MYEGYYKLAGKPFQLIPDARFFFNSKSHKRAMAYLRYGLKQGEGFIVITGDIGTGKTMLVRNLFSELDRDEVVAAQLVTTQIEAEDLLRLVSAAFGLPHDDVSKATLLRNLEVFLRTRRAEGKRILLVVDEAQNLPKRSVEELRMLSNFQEDGRALLQSFLLGQIELNHTLQGEGMEQFRQRIIAGFELRPLDREETELYIKHRLERVGWAGDPEFTPAAFDRVFAATGGVPRRINTLCDRVLLFGSLEEKHRMDDEEIGLVSDEIANEVGRSGARGAARAAAPLSGGQDPVGGDVRERLAQLESEVARLRRQVQRDSRLLRQALLMQLGLGDDDPA
ncbi:MAG: XrtA-associated ATPase [Gammaproteobacteria bacterium]|jgi:putative secretion ATPase (PEP-CTERM system associated)|nr:XrtA-associated ATPase [Gammaproteobacteria bacterium]